jgi:EAL domain-containing protein (putative c-di-GMP-specific phosphodiesterase class I)
VARRQGGPGVHSYEAQHDERRLIEALREAIAADRIEIALQPKVHLASGRPAGLEALARWTLEDGTVVPPSVFITLAERHGLVCALGERVLERSLVLLAQWRDQGLPLVPVAVNFAAPQFHRLDTAQHVAQALARHGLPASLLELELTESLLLSDADAALQTLRSLRELGVRLAIDDFGTGYSSLTYLRRFPVQRLKIDRSFVSAMGQEQGASDIVQMLVQLAHRLCLVCVAEGIETEAQLLQLRALGCDEGQGYLLARPMSPEACATWLLER